jgi:CDP-glucose 4,6-dehydratase
MCAVEAVVNLADFSAYKGKRVLVTGHTGFKGAWLSLWLHRLGAEVYGYSLSPASPEGVYEAAGTGSLVRSRYDDIRDYESLRSAMQEFQPEFVFHLAAQPIVRVSYVDPRQTFDVNVGGTVNVLDCIRNIPSVRSAVLITSDKCYRNNEWIWGYRESDDLGGRDPYSASKAAAELAYSAYADSYFSSAGCAGTATVRAGNVIGGGDWAPSRIVPDCIRALRQGKPVILRNPHATRPWQHVLEPLSGYLQLGLALRESPRQYSGSWNFGPNPDAVYDVLALTRGIVAEWGSGEIREVPDPDAPHEAGLLHLCIDKARFQLKWNPRWNFAETVTHTTAWYRRVHDGESALNVTLEQIGQYGGLEEAREQAEYQPAGGVA